MKHLLNSPLPYLLGFLIGCGIIEACKDSDFEPTLQDEIQGEWVRTDDPTRHYIFGDGYATTWVYNFSTVIAPKWYSTESADEWRALKLREINKPDSLVWTFAPIADDGVLTVIETKYDGVLSVCFSLKRE